MFCRFYISINLSGGFSKRRSGEVDTTGFDGVAEAFSATTEGEIVSCDVAEPENLDADAESFVVADGSGVDIIVLIYIGLEASLFLDAEGRASVVYSNYIYKELNTFIA